MLMGYLEWRAYPGRHPFKEYLKLERQAAARGTATDYVGLDLIPGIVQTEQYAHEVLSRVPNLSVDQRHAMVDVRLGRRANLAPVCCLYVGERALIGLREYLPRTADVRQQLGYLGHVASQLSRVRIVPADVAAGLRSLDPNGEVPESAFGFSLLHMQGGDRVFAESFDRRTGVSSAWTVIGSDVVPYRGALAQMADLPRLVGTTREISEQLFDIAHYQSS